MKGWVGHILSIKKGHLLTSLIINFSFMIIFFKGIVRTLRQSDAQLFAGWGSHPSISDAAMLEKIDHLANKAATLLKVVSVRICLIQ